MTHLRTIPTDARIELVTGPKPTAEGLKTALLINGGSVTRTAGALGVSRQTVHKWMRGYGIYVDRVPVAPPKSA